jgi:hypothetical protein
MDCAVSWWRGRFLITRTLAFFWCLAPRFRGPVLACCHGKVHREPLSERRHMQAQFTVHCFVPLVTYSAKFDKPHELIIAASLKSSGLFFILPTSFSHVIWSLAEKAGNQCKVTACRYFPTKAVELRRATFCLSFQFPLGCSIVISNHTMGSKTRRDVKEPILIKQDFSQILRYKSSIIHRCLELY